MSKFQQVCAILYTQQRFLFRSVNKALRENDRNKLTSLGPYSYLLYPDIGSQITEFNATLDEKFLQQT